MGFFPETIAVYLAGRTISAALLTYMDFKDAPRRWWIGFGPLSTGGHEWQGTGELIQIDGLEQPIGTVAPKMTFTLSGIDATIVGLARRASARVKDRRCTVYIQFFDEKAQTLDNPFAVASGKMDQMTYGAQGPGQRSIVLTAESLWTNRRRPAFGLYTDRDQSARFPGDRGLEQVTDLIHKVIRWPVF